MLTVEDRLAKLEESFNDHRRFTAEAVTALVGIVRRQAERLALAENTLLAVAEVATCGAVDHAKLRAEMDESIGALDAVQEILSANQLLNTKLIGRVGDLVGGVMGNVGLLADQVAIVGGIDPEQLRRDAERPELQVVSCDE